jgi:hypothetical protein
MAKEDGSTCDEAEGLRTEEEGEGGAAEAPFIIGRLARPLRSGVRRPSCPGAFLRRLPPGNYTAVI